MATIAELAAEAFEKSEHLAALAMQNTSTDYDERKQAFIKYAEARAEAQAAQRRLEEAIGGK